MRRSTTSRVSNRMKNLALSFNLRRQPRERDDTELIGVASRDSRNHASQLQQQLQRLALQRKFGNEYKRELYRMEIRCRAQKTDESLQAFTMEVERLVQFTYPGGNHPIVDNFKTRALVNDIRDTDIRLAVCYTLKTTFVETVAFAPSRPLARFL